MTTAQHNQATDQLTPQEIRLYFHCLYLINNKLEKFMDEFNKKLRNAQPYTLHL